MNRALQIIVLTGLAVMLIGCGASGTGSEVAPTSNVSIEAQAPTDTPPPPPTSTPEATATAAVATATDSPAEAIVPSATPRTVQSPRDVLRISPVEAKAMIDGGRAVLYDARSADRYRALHAAGAISFPEDEAAARLDELPEDQALIFYCTWPAEQQSARVAFNVISQGRNPADVYALVGGLAAWQAAGYPTESSQ